MAQRKKPQHKKPSQGKNPKPSNDDKAVPGAAPRSIKTGFKNTFIREPDKIADPATNKTVLIEAIQKNDLEKVAQLLDAGASPNKATKDGRSPLHHAVAVANEDICTLLLEYGCQINSRDKELKTPLFEALKTPEAQKLLPFLLDAGLDADIPDAEGQLPLHVAAATAPVATLRALLDYTDNPNRPDNRGYQALHRAATSNTVEAVQALLFERVALFSSNNEGDTALHLAAGRTDSTAVAEYLLKTEGCGLVNAVAMNGRSPLHLAIIRKHDKLAAKMIEAGANVNLPDHLGATPLHEAAEADSYKLAKLLIENGADVSKSENQPRVTPLILAIKSGSKRMLNLLLEFGADPSKADSDGHTPLMAAVYRSADDTALILLGAGADARVKDKMGRNVLQHVSSNTKADTIGKLVQAGADLNNRDTWQRTPLLSAIMDHNLNLAKELLAQGADVKVVDDQGNAPLVLAISRRKLEIVDKLIEKKADLEATERWSQQTPLHLAAASGMDAEVAKLIKAGANVNAKDHQGRTPLHLAVLNSYGGVTSVKALLQAGADPLAEDNQKFSPWDMATGLDRRTASDAIKLQLQKKGAVPVAKKYNPYGGYYGGGF